MLIHAVYQTKKATKEIFKMLADLRKVCAVGVVGGSDLPKQKEQIGENGSGT